MIDSLITDFEALGIGVIPVFIYSSKDKKLGNLNGEEVIGKYFSENGSFKGVDALVKLTSMYAVESRYNNIEES